MKPRSVTARRPPVAAGRIAAVMALVGATAALAVVAGHSPPEAHAVAQGAGKVTLAPVLDNTLYEESGNLSNGAGQYLFSGRTGNRNNGANRRALLAFDMAANVPAGSTITGAELTLRVSRSNTAIQTTKLHKMQVGWGEGTSDAASPEGSGAGATAGDATWIHSYFNASTWQIPGGDYSPTVSASAEVGQPFDDVG